MTLKPTLTEPQHCKTPIAASFTADLTYLDAKGQQHVLEYMKFTDACGDGN
ncbi:hypothetical protein [Pseudomonas sp. PWP3-1b2]|uniref:hypothetical protein n=1 Tax=Pseudomonas sp. PWP3-1b2 TaxID=2804656 RepID=UPI003CFBAF6E